jgi:hypothetical protein
MSSLLESRSAHHSHPATVPSNGEPQTLPEKIDDEARAYRDRGDSLARFLADHLERLAQLVRWTRANTPEDHDARMEVWDSEISARTYDRGYEDGLDAARREYGLRHGFPLD